MIPRGRESYQSQRVNLFVWHVTISSGDLCDQLLPPSRQFTTGHLCSSVGIRRAGEGTLEAAPPEIVPALFCRNVMLLAWDIPSYNHSENQRETKSLLKLQKSFSIMYWLLQHSTTRAQFMQLQPDTAALLDVAGDVNTPTEKHAIIIFVFCTSALEINQHLMDTAFITLCNPAGIWVLNLTKPNHGAGKPVHLPALLFTPWKGPVRPLGSIKSWLRKRISCCALLDAPIHSGMPELVAFKL